ncbi:MAG TPA: sugar ABC transporter permease [Gaiellaceae bacterium]|nr:sugar ABC transporter permease [Gaiellaceae bacterium]
MASAASTETAGPPRGARRSWSTFRERETWTAYLFILPWVFGFLALTAGPMVASLYFSLTDYGVQQIAGFEKTTFIGTENYRELLNDPKIATSLKNTFVYTLMTVPAKMMVALGLAMILARLAYAAGFFRTVFYLPDITPPVAIGILILALFNGSVGVVNKALGFIGIPGPFWTTDPNWIKPSLAIMSVWTVGGTMVIYLAALKAVPQHLYEAASMDGAGPWRRFFNVTLPMISPALFFTFIVLTIAGLQTFTEVFTAYFGAGSTGAEAPDAALMNVVYLFRQAFEFFNMGFASAMAWLLFAIIMVITAIQFVVSRRFVFYQGEKR